MLLHIPGAPEPLTAERLPHSPPGPPRRGRRLLLALALLVGPGVTAQPVIRPIIQTTVAALPAGASNGAVRLIGDGNAADDCTVGGGSTFVWCVKTGAGWVAFGDGGGSGGTAAAGDSATGFFPTGTLEHERGGLEVDASAFGGLVRIAAGSTTAVSTLAALNAALGSSIADGAHTVDTDTTCLDAGVVCLFAASATEGGAATSVTEGAVTAHQAALAITEAQITDLAHTVDTDDQTATEVPYTPTTGADWTNPDPAEVGGALDALAGRLTVEEAKVDDDVPEDADLGSGTADATTFLRGDRTWAVPAGAGSAMSIDADDDGTPEVTSTGRDLNDDGTQEMTYSIAGGYVVLTSGGSASQGMQFSVPTNDEFRFAIGGTLHVDIRNGGLRTLTTLTVNSTQANTSSTQTCVDNGVAAVGTLSVSVSGASNVRIVSADPDGCDLVLLETGAVDGQLLELELTSSAGGTVTLPDTPGVQNLSGAWNPGEGDSLTLRYNTTAAEWRERARADI